MLLKVDQTIDQTVARTARASEQLGPTSGCYWPGQSSLISCPAQHGLYLWGLAAILAQAQRCPQQHESGVCLLMQSGSHAVL